MAGGQKVHVMKQKSQAHEKNVGKRKSGADGKGSFLNNPKIGPVLLGFLVFVVVGSLLLQIVRNATSGQKAIGV